jgi:hypothetical protein
MSLSVEHISDMIKIVGLAVGGLWAAWTFHKLQRIRAAELENNARLISIQKTTLEQEEIRARLLRQQPQLDIQLEVTERVLVTETHQSYL